MRGWLAKKRGGPPRERLTKQEKLRNRRVQEYAHRFSISKDEARTLYDRQRAEVCEICLQPETESRWSVLAVDHDHETGKVRGLLCSRCNLLLGRAVDSVELLNKLADYLTKHGKTA